MGKLVVYKARDRRVYNGAPCSDMQAEWNNISRLSKLLKSIDKTASCTYFPLERKYLVFTNSNLLDNPDLEGPPVELTGNFHSCKQVALIEAIKALQEKG